MPRSNGFMVCPSAISKTISFFSDAASLGGLSQSCRLIDLAWSSREEEGGGGIRRVYSAIWGFSMNA